MTPYELKILLAVHASPTHWRDNLDDVPRNDLWYETMEWLKRERFINADDKPTDRLNVYIEAICRLPWPIEKWTMP